MSLRLQVLLRPSDASHAEVALKFVGDRADLAALAMAEWLSEEVPALFREREFPFDTPSSN